jgi:hypothetical protein
MPRSPEQTCESNISSSKLEGVSETVANPANSRPQTGITDLFMAAESTNTSGDEEPLSAPISGLDVPLDAGVVAGWVGLLTEFRRDVSDAERIDQIRELEKLKAAAAAAQARITVDLDTSVRAAHAAAGIPTQRQGRGVAGQIALARQESPYRGSRHLGLGKMLVGEMPHTLAALARGSISE